MTDVDEILKRCLWIIRLFAVQKDFIITPEVRFFRLFQSRIYNLITSQSDRFQSIIDSLADEESKKLYCRDLEFHLLSTVFPTEIVALLTHHTFMDTKDHYRMLIDAEISPFNKGVAYPHYTAQLYILDNYCLPGICCPEKGNVVFDIGAFDGLTAKKFSTLVGNDGKVFAVEANPNQIESIKLEVMEYKNIEVINCAFHDKTGPVSIIEQGSSSQIGTGAVTTRGCLLDDFVSENKIDKVDFIKMDIEGAELRALQGAIQTIRRDKPKMALCIYHRSGRDLLSIPLFIQSLNLDYKLFVRKYSYTAIETVLYCVP